ncbi:hypothetical protein BWQ96_03096 [Gracilariopsis chorda]|uniref:Uncharacterized protein n=1 Tax=Gracilariopsis chorda TaxID=448386 RepID=A0A2V3IYD7_9FLOR|nr:hypothetical protein BWQ96_03096 [Gracilariopsis chorda]|eukprot:PXF47154.1 hypothetical protein BWQ96_03096 [Gracilariopsis chorda]
MPPFSRLPINTPGNIQAYGIMITEFIPFGDKRNKDPRFLLAIRKELDGILKRVTWKVVYTEELPSDANVIGGRFVLYIQNAET